MTRQGLIQLYTGSGKGKTTAAVGQALRAVGHGFKVYMLQFMKGRAYGELLAARRFIPSFTIVQSGRDEFVDPVHPEAVDLELARKGLGMAGEALHSGQYQMVILDEINVAVAFGLLTEKEVLELIRQKPASVDLILTGRYAPPSFHQVADLVSVIEEEKHHYQRGVEAAPGIEY